RRRTVTGATQEASHAGRALDQVPGFVGQIHFHQHVAGVDAPFSDGLFATLYFDDFFGRDQNLTEAIFEAGAGNAVDQRTLHAFLHSGINVNDIPTLAHV